MPITFGGDSLSAGPQLDFGIQPLSISSFEPSIAPVGTGSSLFSDWSLDSFAGGLERFTSGLSEGVGNISDVVGNVARAGSVVREAFTSRGSNPNVQLVSTAEGSRPVPTGQQGDAVRGFTIPTPQFLQRGQGGGLSPTVLLVGGAVIVGLFFFMRGRRG